MIKFIIENYNIGGVLYETIETEKANTITQIKVYENKKKLLTELQNEYEGYKRVISNCDSVGTEDSNLATNSQGSEDKENKKEGEASLCYSRAATTNAGSTALMNFYLKETKDVTGYKYFSCKIGMISRSKMGSFSLR